MNKLLLALKIVQTYKNWYLFFLSYLELSKKSGYIDYKLRNGMIYKTRANTSDFAILNEITIFKEYFHPDYFNVDKDSIIFDFGGQAGDFATYVGYKYNSYIYSFEPDLENFNLMNTNIKLNNLEDKIKTFNLAVANKTGEIKFFTSNHQNKGVHSSFYKGGNTETMVDAISLSDILKETKVARIDFLKIDIEGAEHELIISENEFFFSKVRNLVMEYHCQEHVTNKRPVSELVSQLELFGFDVMRQNDREDLGILYAKKKT